MQILKLEYLTSQAPKFLLLDAGAIWELHDLAAKARGHKTNCLLLDSFLQDIMRTLDNQGKSLGDADSLQLAHLLELIEAAIELVDSCNKPGERMSPFAFAL